MPGSTGKVKRRAMYNIYGLRQGPNVGVRPKANKNFYLWLTVEKIHAFAFFYQETFMALWL